MRSSILSLTKVVAVLASLLTTQSATLNMPASAAGGSAAQKTPIKIGLVVTLTGAVSATGKGMVKGMELYLDDIKHKMAGHPVELIVENDEGNPATAMAKIQKLVEQDKVQ